MRKPLTDVEIALGVTERKRKCAMNRSNVNKGMLLYCVAKSTVVRKDSTSDSEIIDRLEFGDTVGCEDLEVVNHRIKINYQIPVKRKPQKARAKGWVPIAAMTAVTVEDYCGLYFTTITEAPVFNRFHGQKTGVIPNGTRVKMKAKVGEWCLTNRGWSLIENFRKNREIVASEAACKELLGAFLKQAVYDWDSYYAKLRNGICNEDEFITVMSDFMSVERFFSTMYLSYHLRLLYKQRAVDLKWLQQQKSKFAELQKKGHTKLKKEKETDDPDAWILTTNGKVIPKRKGVKWL